MSAIHFIRLKGKNKIAVVADTAIYDWSGVVRAFGSKIEVCTRIPAVIAVCGKLAVGNAVKAALRDSESFDELIDGMRVCIAHAGSEPMTFAVCGFAGASPEVWLADTVGGLRLPFERRADVHLGQPPLSGTDIRRAFGEISDPGQVDLDILARGLILLSREHSTWPAFSGPKCLVGGACEVAEISRDGVEVRTVMTFPDEIGEMIQLAPVDWNDFRARASRCVAHPPGMSRQQRRAAAAKARAA